MNRKKYFEHYTTPENVPLIAVMMFPVTELLQRMLFPSSHSLKPSGRRYFGEVRADYCRIAVS